MQKLTVKTREGKVETINAPTDSSVMGAIRNAGFDELLALCGGCCSCATCHVYIDPEFISLLSPMSTEEKDLLDASEYRTSNSRLSCQIKFTAALNGLIVKIAPID
jgi:ferredoxin, 2Fe-2S